MNHVRDRLQRYVDGELDAAESTAVQRHCRDCPECAHALAALQALWTQLEPPPVPPLSRSLWGGISRRLAAVTVAEARDGMARRSVRAQRALTWSLSGGALAAGIVLGLVMGRGAFLANEADDRTEAKLPGSEESLVLGSGDATLGGLWLATAQSEEAGS